MGTNKTIRVSEPMATLEHQQNRKTNMQAFRQIYDNVEHDLQITLPDELLHQKLEVIILPLEENKQTQSASQALKDFLASKDTEALADLDTSLFSENRKQDFGRTVDL